jgi:hypothetical protein
LTGIYRYGIADVFKTGHQLNEELELNF